MTSVAVPVLRVTDAVAAEEFRCGRLAFTRQWVYHATPGHPNPAYLAVERDGARLHLSSFAGDGIAGAAVYVYVDDVDALHRELSARGVQAESGPLDQDWGTREMHVRDPDGNRIRFGQLLHG